MSWLRHSVRGSLPLSTLPKCAFRPITIPRYTSTLASKSTPRISPLNVRRIVYVSAFTFLSAYFGIFFQSHPTWLAPPSPDSEEDKYQVSDYVKKLSALILPASEEEIQITYDEGNHIVKEEMRGIRGLAEQRAWWNKEEKRLTIAVWFGGSLAGWPGVTHGGVVATMFMEGMKKAIELGYGSGMHAYMSTI
ncbi:hypothetical protein EJ08DRAFT_384152 [Tothia fuscella]|uniref:Uncharacterized protein n=1 Tax=Tothia fuscella TaxID=1048955 RepID=A0A9P4NL13_9PEZI|nr:hypothetical protein EJ08DRAFT_384152 [Tothia fuscella]